MDAQFARAPTRALTVVAPHADDAALSLGGTLHALARAGADITLVTCHSASAWAPASPLHGDAATVTRLRAREDGRYARLLGAQLVRLAFAEAALRRPELPVERRTNAGDRAHGRALRRALAPHLGPLVLAPLAIGEHVDHLLARAAVVAGGGRRPLGFYEDLPYGLWSDWPALLARVRVTERLIARRLHPWRLPAVQLLARQRALGCYPSQFSARERRDIDRSVRRRGGELVWATRRMRAALDRWAGIKA